MYVLLKIKRNKYREIRRKNRSGSIQKNMIYRITCRPEFFCFISELKGLRKKAKKSPYLDCSRWDFYDKEI
jgi:hypothetical protein